MLSKGDLIDWDEIERDLSAYMRRTHGTAANEQAFWHSQGGFECFFTLIDGKMYKNSYFDTPVTLVELRERDLPDKRVKINWDSIHADWSDFWRHRGFAQDQLEGYEEFWKRLGGINRYFDTDDNGVRTCREYLLDIPKHTSAERIKDLYNTASRYASEYLDNRTKINWEALYLEFSAHMSQRPKDMGHALWVIQFWDDRGGSKRYFDKGPFGETIRRECLLDLPDKRIKIDWDELTRLWNEHWRTPPTRTAEVEEHRDTFWMKHGGFEAYFDNGPFGVPTRREYMREADEPGMYEAPPKTHYWDGPENVIAD